MNEKIMNWSSKMFYHQMLYAAEQVKSHSLCDLGAGIKGTPMATVLRMFDTSKAGMQAICNNSKKCPSFANVGEAGAVVEYVEALMRNNIRPDQIAVITPYKYQVLDINSISRKACYLNYFSIKIF